MRPGRLMLLLLLLLTGAWWLRQDTRSPVEPQQTDVARHVADSSQPQVQPMTPPVEAAAEAIEEPTAPHRQNSDEQQALLAEIANRQYSEDAFLEIKSLGWQIGYCAHQSDLDALFGNDVTVQQQALNDQVRSHCQSVTESHPKLVSLYAGDRWQEVFKPQSPLGHLYPQRKSAASKEEVQEYTREVVTQLLQKENGALLLEEVFLGYLDPVELIFPVAEILGSRDSLYNQEVNKAALTLIACQFNQGQNCQEVGMFMILNCAYERTACGQNFNNWYTASTLPGMQRDVQLLVDYYLQLSTRR